MEIKRQIAQVNTVAKLSPGVQSLNNPVSNMGSVSKINVPVGNPSALGSFRVALTSASGAAKNFIIGDPSGLLSSLKGGTNAAPDSWTGGITVAAAQATFAYAPVAIKSINYQVTASSAQFANTFQYLIGDIDGSFRFENIPVNAAQRNTAYNDKLLTIEFEQPLVLSWNRALFLNVNDGEDVYLEFTPCAAANRN